MNEEKRTCLARFHPFKQQWYRYIPDYSSPKYCSSCEFAFKNASIILGAVLQSRETLYGNKMIQIDKQTAHEIVDLVYEVENENR